MLYAIKCECVAQKKGFVRIVIRVDLLRNKSLDLTDIQRETFLEELKSIQKTKFTLRRTVPKKLSTLWSDLLTDIALGMADATKESEAWRALKKYLMLKAVLIQPLRGGG